MQENTTPSLSDMYLMETKVLYYSTRQTLQHFPHVRNFDFRLT